MAEHLGYDKHDPVGRGSGNSRNGARAKTVFTEIGAVEIEVPRDTNSTFDPVIVKKRQRRLTGVDEIVLSLTAKGLTTGEIAAHFDDVYGATVSKDTISKITDKVIEEMTEWCSNFLPFGPPHALEPSSRLGNFVAALPSQPSTHVPQQKTGKNRNRLGRESATPLVGGSSPAAPLPNQGCSPAQRCVSASRRRPIYRPGRPVRAGLQRRCVLSAHR